jgi:hypothetical protein
VISLLCRGPKQCLDMLRRRGGEGLPLIKPLSSHFTRMIDPHEPGRVANLLGLKVGLRQLTPRHGPPRARGLGGEGLQCVVEGAENAVKAREANQSFYWAKLPPALLARCATALPISASEYAPPPCAPMAPLPLSEEVSRAS